jgi:hypothetical protein
MEKEKLENILNKNKKFDLELNELDLNRFSRLSGTEIEELREYFLREKDSEECDNLEEK